MEQRSETQPLGARDERYFFAAVFLVSASVLMLQIALTRVFSFTLWYHFAYVTISVALLGYGASGTLLAVFPGLAGRDPARRLSLYATSSGLTVIVAYLAFSKLPFYPFQLREKPGIQIPLMLVYYAAITAPFFFAGLCMSVALSKSAARTRASSPGHGASTAAPRWSAPCWPWSSRCRSASGP